MNQIKQICGPETQSNISVNTSKTDYSSINSSSSSADDTADPTSLCDDSHHISTDSGYDTMVCDISIHVEKARLCQAKQGHDSVLGKWNASLVKNILANSDAPHLDTEALIQKLDKIAKTVDLDVSIILTKQIKDPGPSSWYCTFADS